MKKILILLLIILNNCNGYEAIYSRSNKQIFINSIENVNNDKISRIVIRKLNLYKNSSSSQNELDLRIESFEEDVVILRDSKGDPQIFKKIVNINLIAVKQNEQKILNYSKNTNYNNQDNKFNLNQYKKKLTQSLIDTILEQIILDLSSI